MKPYYAHRQNYVRPRSRNDRGGLGFDHCRALWRNEEEGSWERFRRRTYALLSRDILRETDPQVYYQSPFIPKPHYEPGAFLPTRRRGVTRNRFMQP